MNIMKNRLFKILAGIVLFTAILLTAIPFGAKYYLSKWLVENGADSAAISSLRYNPFLGRLTFDGLKTETGEKSLLNHGSLVVDLGITSLFKKNIHIEQFSYQNLFIDLEQSADGQWRYGTYTMKESGAKEETTPKKNLDWGFLADQISLSNCVIHLRTADIDMTFTVDEAKLEQFSTRAEQQIGTLNLKGSINKSPLELTVNILELTPELKIAADIDFSDFQLAELKSFLEKSVPQLTGALGIDGKVDFTLTADSSITAQYNGNVELTSLVAVTPEAEADAGTVSWQGAVTYSSPKGGTASAKTDGTLSTREVNIKLPAQEINLSNKEIDFKAKTDVVLGKELTVTNNGALTIAGLAVSLPDLAIDQENFTWEGNLKLNPAAIENMAVKGGLGLQKLSINLSGTTPLKVNLDSFQLDNLALQGTSSFAFAKALFSGLETISPDAQSQIAQLSSIELRDIKGSTSPEVSAAAISLKDIVLLPGKEQQDNVLSLGEISAKAINWSNENGIMGDTITLSNLLANIFIDENGNMNISSRLSTIQDSDEGTAEKVTEKSEPTTDQQDAPTKPMNIRFKEISLNGMNIVNFADKSLPVPYKTALQIDTFQLLNLDSTKKDKQVELLFKGNVEERAPIKISGHLAPFKPKPAINLDLLLKNYPLSSLTPYTVKAIGTELASGQLKLTSSIGLAEDNLDLKNNVFLEKLKTDTIDPELAKELDNQLPIPLDAALAMLKDSDDNINLDIPVKGPVNDISVGISDVVVTALNKSIVSAASSYFMYSLGPYAALAYVGMKVGEQMMQVNLPPVVFEIGGTSLQAEHIDYLKRIATILKEKPETDLQLHPKVLAGDLLPEDQRSTTPKSVKEISKEQKEKLQKFGLKRAQTVQEHLVKRYSIDKTRLLIVDTEILTGKDVKPAVILEVKQ